MGYLIHAGGTPLPYAERYPLGLPRSSGSNGKTAKIWHRILGLAVRRNPSF